MCTYAWYYSIVCIVYTNECVMWWFIKFSGAKFILFFNYLINISVCFKLFNLNIVSEFFNFLFVCFLWINFSNALCEFQYWFELLNFFIVVRSIQSHSCTGEKNFMSPHRTTTIFWFWPSPEWVSRLMLLCFSELQKRILWNVYV